ARRDSSDVLGWLREHVHAPGVTVSVQDPLVLAPGERLNTVLYRKHNAYRYHGSPFYRKKETNIATCRPSRPCATVVPRDRPPPTPTSSPSPRGSAATGGFRSPAARRVRTWRCTSTAFAARTTVRAWP